ncbi:MAG: hypothetical protein M0P71_07495 [Melioribacteraceae bacterium]|jgi:hypothetical protein|nr:hypothetical protein [Melioribacteraceae bacterium]MDD3982802.1 hypothetical protein [Candidatus Omnitrophota bacterium]
MLTTEMESYQVLPAGKHNYYYPNYCPECFTDLDEHCIICGVYYNNLDEDLHCKECAELCGQVHKLWKGWTVEMMVFPNLYQKR